MKKELETIVKHNKPNTYTFGIKEKRVDVYLEKSLTTSNLIALQPNKNEFYIKIENHFYSLTPTNIPTSLAVEKNTIIIEQLNKIVFQNQ